MPVSKVSVSGLQPGLSTLARSIAGDGSTYDQGFQQQLLAQSTLGKSIAQARLDNLKSDELQQQLDSRKPDAVLNNVLQGNGVPLNAAPDVKEFQNTGRIGKYAPIADGLQGPTMDAPDWTKNLGAVGRQIMSLNNALTIGDKNSENVAKATGEYRNQNLGDQVLRGGLSPLAVAASQYAVSGKAPYSFHEFGVGNNLDGTVDATSVPAQNLAGLRVAETGKNTAQAGAAKAAAVNSYASAGQHNAQTQKVRQDIDMGSKGVLRDTPDGVYLVDPRTGTSRAVTGPDGQPLAGKSKDLTEGQAKANLFGSRAQEADKLLNNLGLEGVYRPSALKQAGDAVPLVGPVTGALGNALASPKQRQVEQAQRDFVNAVLRRESGAAIAESEFANASKQYFPQPFDDKDTRAQKARNRALAVQGILQEVPENKRGVKMPSAGGAKNVTVDY